MAVRAPLVNNTQPLTNAFLLCLPSFPHGFCLTTKYTRRGCQAAGRATTLTGAVPLTTHPELAATRPLDRFSTRNIFSCVAM